MKKTSLMFIAVLGVGLLSGCAPNTRWAWNNYQDHLYDYYGQKINGEEYIARVLAAVDEAKQRNVRVAPGLYAEIGTFYARAGDFDKALSYYELERQTWPESEGFMTSLIDGIQRNLKNQSEEKQS